MDKADVLKRIIQLHGKHIIGCTFIKKDGSVRDMRFRLGVSKHVNGNRPEATEARKQTLKAIGMLGVYEMSGNDSKYRTINLNTIKRLVVEGVEVYKEDENFDE